jgi:hypothetical protein
MQSIGVKGSDIYTSSGNLLLDLSVSLVRNANSANIRQNVYDLMNNPTPQTIEDLYILTFHTRAIRGGKGEKKLFIDLYTALSQMNLDLTNDLMDLIANFGSWKDICKLSYNPDLNKRAIELFKKQLQEDYINESPSISLAAKWAPREGKEDHLFATQLAKEMYPSDKISTSLNMYRKLVSGLNKRIKTMEILMCSGKWCNIIPQSVPGRAGKKYSRALLNLVGTRKKGEEIPHDKINELRKPNDEDRMQCRENFMAHYAKAKVGQAIVHGADTLFPNEVVKKAYNCNLSESERSQLIGIWNGMVEKAKKAGGLKRTIFMSDFSGSMGNSHSDANSPYWVSVGLGMLGAEISEGAFHNKLMTFDATPKWHLFSEGDLFSRLETIGPHLGQGTSTDFQKAMDLVLETLKKERVKPGEEPENIVVLTDMGWDQACGSNNHGYYSGNSYRHHVKTEAWQTHVEMIRETFKRTGEDMWGVSQGFKMPRIVIWNLSSNYSSEFHAQADTIGVALLSGWSPALFEVLQSEGPRELTPLDVLRIELSNPRYNIVRERVRTWINSHINPPNFSYYI